MNVFKSVIGPKSKYDKTIPYAYVAKIHIIENDDEMCRYYYGDTICSLIEYLDNQSIFPHEVSIFGLFKGDQVPIELKYCIDEKGDWLVKPELCRSLENHYQESLDLIYKGHVEYGECCFEDRTGAVI